jgi:hypothetical protein
MGKNTFTTWTNPKYGLTSAEKLRRIFMTVNQYEASWELYKHQSNSFGFDFDFYYDFCKGYKTLVAFAGYGRLSNFLSSKGVDIYANELSPDFAKFINIPKEKIQIGSFLDLNQTEKFERIIIAYNAFALITDEKNIKKMFSIIEKILTPTGKISLSYYHPNNWTDNNIYEFNYNGEIVKYHSTFDLSDRGNKNGVWIDNYKIGDRHSNYRYDLRIYEDENDLKKMIAHTNLCLIKEVKNYNNTKIMEEGWIEYILQLQ